MKLAFTYIIATLTIASVLVIISHSISLLLQLEITFILSNIALLAIAALIVHGVMNK
ncbi:hypothetical protein [Virgibacillus litoralis]|uniref:Uncharacterized protein n=1 Tax=Virgibacillus litoralis TaxID=578221 RepID=A0ABS4HH67_9BACI|nr:hypothetical protein [Virgibacillus litoralis]MBP1950270.1 hypothetical protein [Virgibacillus litoralis]